MKDAKRNMVPGSFHRAFRHARFQDREDRQPPRFRSLFWLVQRSTIIQMATNIQGTLHPFKSPNKYARHYYLQVYSLIQMGYFPTRYNLIHLK